MATLEVLRYIAAKCDAGVHAKNGLGSIALMLAAVKGHIEVVRYLTEQCGLDVNAKNKDSYRARFKMTALKLCGISLKNVVL